VKKIVIEIDEADREDIGNIHFVREDLKFKIGKAIMNGTPLNEVLDKIKAEIREFSVVDESGTYRISTYLVDQIIDKYKAESEE